MRLKSFLTHAVWAMILCAASPALAHVHLVSSTPGERSAVSAPTTISLRFNGPLVSRVSAIKLMDGKGGEVAVSLLPSGSTEIVARPDQPLAPGVYRATWTAAGENDGHGMSGNIGLTVK